MANPINKTVAKYWLDFYINNGLCSLCGNSGIVNTTVTAERVGRVNWCFCPNGQNMRKGAEGKEPIEYLRPEV